MGDAQQRGTNIACRAGFESVHCLPVKSESIQILDRSDLVFLRIVSGQPPFQDFIDIAAALLTESGSLTGFSKPSFRKLESKVCGGFVSCFLPPKVCQLSCYRTVSGQSCQTVRGL